MFSINEVLVNGKCQQRVKEHRSKTILEHVFIAIDKHNSSETKNDNNYALVPNKLRVVLIKDIVKTDTHERMKENVPCSV